MRLMTAAEVHFLTLNFVLLVAVPIGVVTVIGPVAEPVATVALNCVDETFWNELAATPLNATDVVFDRFWPLIATTVPTLPEVGEKLVISGRITVKDVELVALPSGVTTLMGPLLALEGTVAVICVAESTLYEPADCPLKATAVAPLK